MTLTAIEEAIYLFVVRRQDSNAVHLQNIRLFAKREKIEPQKMGYAIKQLEQKGILLKRNGGREYIARI